MDNMELYNKLKFVPDVAKKPISGGRLKGMTDINPMWRIKVITEQFGPCGIGWYYTIDKQWIEIGNGVEQKAFCNISFYYKVGEVWSMPIPGTGGSDFVTQETNKVFTSDECFKMALTDALSVAMKSVGVGADVYFEKDRTKYNSKDEGNGVADKIDEKKAFVLKKKAGDRLEKLLEYYKVKTVEELTVKQFSSAMTQLDKQNA